MNPIINNSFTVGDMFVGNANGAKLAVVKVAKGHSTGKQSRTYVSFRDLKTGRVFETNFDTAQRLLLTKI